MDLPGLVAQQSHKQPFHLRKHVNASIEGGL